MSEQREGSGGLGQIHNKAEEILNVRAEVVKDQNRAAFMVDRIGHQLARPTLFFSLLGVHLLWVAVNLRAFPGFAPWDPYPYVFLATVASALGPFLTLLVLMYQRRTARIAELREELSLQVALHLERQNSVTLRLLRELQDGTGVATQQDGELLEDLQKELDAKRLMQNVRQELEQKSE